jgi:hypothetical protein
MLFGFSAASSSLNFDLPLGLASKIEPSSSEFDDLLERAVIKVSIVVVREGGGGETGSLPL